MPPVRDRVEGLRVSVSVQTRSGSKLHASYEAHQLCVSIPSLGSSWMEGFCERVDRRAQIMMKAISNDPRGTSIRETDHDVIFWFPEDGGIVVSADSRDQSRRRPR